jgi:RNA recognition motif-containing protein
MELEADMLGKKKERESINKKLLAQIEFYFSDENLINDKYMKQLISNDNEKGVEVKAFLKFNKIKNILGSDDRGERRIIKVIPLSNILTLNSDKTKILRKNKFEVNTKLVKNIDDRTIYVENIPINATHENLNKLFSREGRVVNVSIPKDKEKKGKGFTFITYQTSEEAEKAIKSLNNLIPNEFLKWGSGYDLKALRIISKTEWLRLKEEFKKLKKELQLDNTELFAECLPNTNNTILQKGTLIRLSNIPKNKNKNDVKIFVSHYIVPSYVDLTPNDCIIRFSQPTLADLFLTKINNSKFDDNIIQGVKIESPEEDEYLDKIRRKIINK